MRRRRREWCFVGARFEVIQLSLDKAV
jgi:hypothetical protein